MLEWSKAGRKERAPLVEDKLLKEMRAQRESTERVIATVTEVVNTQARATAAMANSFAGYLELFKVSSPPVARTTNDEDQAERELVKRGYPINGTPEEQLRFLLRDE